jgi:predicted Zn-dependent protease
MKLSGTRLFLTTMIAILSSGCAARQGVPVGQIPVFSAPAVLEVEQVKSAVDQSLKGEGKTVYTSGPIHARATRIIDRLSVAAGAGSFHFPVLIADAGEEVNAMVADGKTVIVYKALMDKVPQDDELATVLAHEIGHALGKHQDDEGSDERKSEVEIGSSILGAAANIALSAAGYGGLGSLAGDVTETTVGAVGMGAYVLSYDRDMEYEADHIGMMVMAKAGYNPEAALRFWEKSDEIFGGSNSMSFFSTHPSNSDRLEKLSEYLPLARAYYDQAGGGRAEARKPATPASSVKAKGKKK